MKNFHELTRCRTLHILIPIKKIVKKSNTKENLRISVWKKLNYSLMTGGNKKVIHT